MRKTVRTAAVLAAAVLAALAGCDAMPTKTTPIPTSTDGPPASPTATAIVVADTIPGTLYYEAWYDNADGDGIDFYRLTGTEWAKVATAPDSRNASLSPDGRLIAYGDPVSGALIVTNLDGSNKRTLNGSARSSRWSPDSRQIVYMKQGTEPRSSIHVVNVDGSGSRQLAAEGRTPVWSPDGAWIAYVSTDYYDKPAKVTVVHPDGTGARTVIISPATELVHQLNGMSLGATSIRANTICGTEGCGDPGSAGRNLGTTIIDTTTGNTARLVADQGEARTQLWTADGRTLIRTETSRGSANAPSSYALELHAADGTLLARQPEPPMTVNAGLALYIP